MWIAYYRCMINDPIPSAMAEKDSAPPEDNARKFVLTGLTPEFLSEYGEEATSADLMIDFIEVGVDREVKVVHKTADDGTVTMTLIENVTKEDGGRVPTKSNLADIYNVPSKNGGRLFQSPEAMYQDLSNRSLCRIGKNRLEFGYKQDDRRLTLKFDTFNGSTLRLLEVDGTPDDRDAFDPDDFPVRLTEVSDNPEFTGATIAGVLAEWA